ncbi:MULTISPECIES: thiamine-phosphate kinase [Methanobacterium]|jgi:thiamine-monophosphate kinase|uniref:Thiamine-monophosphate kinase n=1 Tax=Methanobacterium veterum TaxID=408577 RepID=A0A9E5A4W1_9EURY|nr:MULTISPECIES: thiamine-phosphate kinase [Methanobacterium]MCZ3365502.1 thiamine-phosphate kinase [Methanobacterium veterum]MCZ3373254.1 thiamine-phosphate kinase [Methanobacterium veterum]
MPRKISDIGEKGLIKRILSKTEKSDFNSTFLDKFSFKSLSDDAALINLGDQYLVATSDMLFKSTHFPDDMSYNQIGKKSVTVNVSDLAAMGAKPVGIIISMGLPRDMLLDEFEELIEGILDMCSKYGMKLIGGDTNESHELTLCGTCLGIVQKENVLMKDGAKPGDIIAVTGPVGLAAAGFEILFNKNQFQDLNPNYKDHLLKHALNPKARTNEGILLAKSGIITSATDITDGLVSEIDELINANNYRIGMTLNEEMLPIPEEIIEVANKTGKNPLEFAFYYGEDFELLLTVKKEGFKQIKERIHLYEIGNVTSSGKIEILHKDGTKSVIKPRGYEHLSPKKG